MYTLSQLTDAFAFLTYIVVVMVAGWLLYRSYSIFYRKRKRVWFWKVEKQPLPKVLKMAAAITLLAMILCAPAVVLILSPYGRFISPGLTGTLLSAILVGGMAELVLATTISERLMRHRWKQAAAAVMIIVMAVVFIPLFVAMPQFMADPPMEGAIELELPIEGTWAAGHAGASSRVNYHSAYRSQKYAIDIVKVNEEGRFFEREGKEMEDFFTYEASIFAPISGKVVKAVNHLPDKAVSFTPNDTLNPAGNHVVIQIGPEQYVFLAHLKAGSLTVAEGDTVEAGQMIGLAGNSGNTSWPHLHLHIQDRSEIGGSATAYPFFFRQFQHKRWFRWKLVENEFLLRNDLFRPMEE